MLKVKDFKFSLAVLDRSGHPDPAWNSVGNYIWQGQIQSGGIHLLIKDGNHWFCSEEKPPKEISFGDVYKVCRKFSDDGEFSKDVLIKI